MINQSSSGTESTTQIVKDNEEKKVAYSGVPGAYADIAASKVFPDYKRVSCTSFGNVYKAVENGSCNYGVLPIENSFAGDVAGVLDLLFFGNLNIVGIYELPIVHCLLGNSSSDISTISTVYSHPQAIDQCAGFIKENKLASIVATNTAVAAKEVSVKNDSSIAAIGSKQTAELYNLKVLKEEINDSKDNMTRFIVISKDNKPLLNNKENFSLIFTVKNEAGALAKAISIIGLNGFNMKAIRSRPVKSLAWNYYFFIEGEGDLSEGKGVSMLNELNVTCETVRVLGNYPEDILLD